MLNIIIHNIVRDRSHISILRNQLKGEGGCLQMTTLHVIVTNATTLKVITKETGSEGV